MHFVYDEAGKPMGEYTPDGTTIREYLWIGDTLVALRAGYAGHAFQYVLTDTFNLRYPGQYLDPETGLSCTTSGITSRGRGGMCSRIRLGCQEQSQPSDRSGSPFGLSDAYGLFAPPDSRPHGVP